MPDTAEQAARAPAAGRVWPALAGAFALALAMRGLRYPVVFVDGMVVFSPMDAMYHLRRAFVTFESFPRVLLSDPYLNFPDGAPIPWPPLWDLLTAGAALVLVDDRDGFEVVAAWAAPVTGALTVFPVYLLGKQLGSRGVALGAAWLYAVLPAPVYFSAVGDPDHHALVSLLGTAMLLASSALVERARRGAPLRGPLLGLAGLRLALLFGWHGSLLYLGLIEGTLVLAAVFTGRDRLALAHAGSLALTIALFVAILATFPTPLHGAYSAIAPSRLHAAALGAAAFVALAVAGACRLVPGGGWRLRLASALVAALVCGVFVLSLPGSRAGIATAFEFMTLSDALGPHIFELRPLFPLPDRPASPAASQFWGHLRWLVPLLPLSALLLAGVRGPRRAPALMLLPWVCVLAPLAVSQLRYGNDLAPAAAVLFAASAAQLFERAEARRPWSRAAGVALVLLVGVLALEPVIRGRYADQLGRIVAVLRDPASPARRTPAHALRLFLEDVRSATPPTRGLLDPSQRPEYGIIAPPNLGHAIRYVAGRPASIGPFGSYIGYENWRRAFELLRSQDEQQVLDRAKQLGARYLITRRGPHDNFLKRLHASDGSVRLDMPASRQLRLVVEAPPWALTMVERDVDELGYPLAGAPYKLFEIVEGAVIEAQAGRGARLLARASLRSPRGRAIEFVSVGRGDSDGLVRIRVPQPGEYRLRASRTSGAAQERPEWSARVELADVVAGRVVAARLARE